MASLCFIVDDEPAIGRLVALALHSAGAIDVEQFIDLPSMADALTTRMPQLIFVDASLGATSGADVIRHLAESRYGGVVQMMSGSDAGLIEEALEAGHALGLRMRLPLSKPFRMDAIRAIIAEENLLSAGPGAAVA